MAPPTSPPAFGSSRRSNGSGHSPSRPPVTPPPDMDDPQLEQDLDAARQMSRARANSASHRPYHRNTPASPVHVPTADAQTASLGVGAGAGAGMNASSFSGDYGGGSPLAHPTSPPGQRASYTPRSPLVSSSRAAHFNPHQTGGVAGASHGGYPHSHSDSASVAAAAAAAHFYMGHNRNGSNSSLDSASHFIDHRSQQMLPPNLSPGSHHGASSNNMRSISGVGPRRSQNRLDAVSPSLARAARTQRGFLGEDDSAVVEDDQGHEQQGARAAALASSATRGGGGGGRTGRLIDVGNEDDGDHELDNSLGGEPGQGIHSSSFTMDQPQGMRLGTSVPQGASSETPRTLSRRPSMAQDDVCFPMLTPGVGDEATSGGGGGRASSPYHDGASASHVHQHHHHEHVGARQVEMMPGFPFTFDLATLQDYAEEERARVEQENATASTGLSGGGWGLRQRGAATDIRSNRDARRRGSQVPGDPRSASGAAASAADYGVSPDSDDATFYSRRPRKFLNMPGSGDDDGGQKRSKYQRKLALFEGEGQGPPPIGARASTTAGGTSGGGIFGGGDLMGQERDKHRSQAANATSNGFPVDTKTPLLQDGLQNSSKSHDGAGNTLPSYHGTWDGGARYGDEEDTSRRMGRSMSVGANLSGLSKPTGRRYGNRKLGRQDMSFGPASSLGEKSYRFTFYSNALPNTIHARHLYELPAPGQSFEELLLGLQPGELTRQEQQQEFDAANVNAGLGPENESEAPDAENGGAGSSAEAARSQATQGQAPRAAPSGLSQALNGRMEGSTAPATGANTPEMGSAPHLQRVSQRLEGAGSGDARGASSSRAPSARNVNTGTGNQAQGAAAQTSKEAGIAAAMERARAAPGGGIRMDQDPESNTWWLDVLCPSDAEMKMLSRAFGIHPLTTEDILMEETREKIELFRNYYLVCFRSFDQDPYSPTYLEPLNMYIIVFREGTLSFHFRATPHPQNVRRRIKQLKDYINVTSDWISYALIDDITDAFGPLIQSIEYEVDSIDELVLILKEAEQSDMLRRIGTCRKKVMGLLRLMGNKADVVKGLAKRCNENWSVAPKSDIGLYLSDIQDHLITMTQNLNHYEKILSRSHSNYLAQISIEMTDANNQINDVLSRLTALGTVIVPLNVITGLWGMNVNVPGQDVPNLRWFSGIVAFMVALAVLGYFATIRYLSR